MFRCLLLVLAWAALVMHAHAAGVYSCLDAACEKYCVRASTFTPGGCVAGFGSWHETTCNSDGSVVTSNFFDSSCQSPWVFPFVGVTMAPACSSSNLFTTCTANNATLPETFAWAKQPAPSCDPAFYSNATINPCCNSIHLQVTRSMVNDAINLRIISPAQSCASLSLNTAEYLTFVEQYSCWGGKVSPLPGANQGTDVGDRSSAIQRAVSGGCAMPLQVDGALSDWVNSTCGNGCGVGTLNQTRSCNSPPPFNGGLSCEAQQLGSVLRTDVECVSYDTCVSSSSSSSGAGAIQPASEPSSSDTNSRAVARYSAEGFQAVASGIAVIAAALLLTAH